MTRTDAFVAFFETMQPSSLDRIGDHFAADAHFVDPFNDVHGLPAIRGVFEHMFATCETPRFEVVQQLVEGDTAFLYWHFVFGAADRRRRVTGVTRLQFDATGKVREHLDFWDPARQLYEDIPVLGTLLRALRRRLAALIAGAGAGNHPTTQEHPT